MSKTSFFWWITLLVFSVLNSFKYDFSFPENIILCINAFLSFSYFYRLKCIYDNITSFLFFLYIFFSSVIYVTFGIGGIEYSYGDNAALATFSNHIMFFFFLGSLFCALLCKKKYVSGDIGVAYIPYSKRCVFGILLLAFSLSLLSYVLGIGKMGGEGVQLPFKMNGIIQLIRTEIYPILLLLVVFRNRGDKRMKMYLILFFVWGLLECFVMYSKSRLVFLFLPIILYYILYNRKLDVSLVKKILPVLVVFFILYPVFGAMRYMHSDSLLSTFKEAQIETMETEENQPFWLQPYKRSFMLGGHYMNALPYIDDNVIFDFSRLVEIVLLGGSAAYTTYVIEGYPLTAVHSSGTTGLMDALLLGGYGFCYLTVLVLVLLASYIDGGFFVKILPLKVFFLLIFIDLIRAKTYTILIDALFIPFLVTKISVALIILRACRSSVKCRLSAAAN